LTLNDLRNASDAERRRVEFWIRRSQLLAVMAKVWEAEFGHSDEKGDPPGSNPATC
jgi:hypothetical protein